jgi:3-deoxy-manno-octulosonate cytidylyltransferase (CMP-KDO synthetase)
MIQWVWEGVRRARTLDDVLVATDDERIRDCVAAFGGRAVLTSARHATGTDRIAEVAATLRAEVLVNVQGDEPLVEGEHVDAAVRALLGDEGAALATLATPLRTAAELASPSVVKVVTDASGRALYFSRAAIPHGRGLPPGVVPGPALRHVGLYAYRRDALLRLAGLGPSPLEACESLEQLRALENAMAIRVAVVAHEALAVDTPEDVAPAAARLEQRARGAGRSLMEGRR